MQLNLEVEHDAGLVFGISEIARRIGQFEGGRHVISPPVQRRMSLSNLHANLLICGIALSREQVAQLVGEGGLPQGAPGAETAARFVSLYRQARLISPISRRALMQAVLFLGDGQPILGGQKAGATAWNEAAKEAILAADRLFHYFQKEQAVHPIVKAAVVHHQLIRYGRITATAEGVARLWHRLLLSLEHPLFFHVPLEHYFQQNQGQLNDALAEESPGAFVRLSISLLGGALVTLLEQADQGPKNSRERLGFARVHFGGQRFGRKAYMALVGAIGPATASRDLKEAVESGLLKKVGTNARTRYFFVTGPTDCPSKDPVIQASL